MTKLRRLGLVKMTQLTNDGLIMLTERRHTLERVHLSYCNKLSGYGMQHFLNKMTRLTHMSLTGINAFKNDSFKRFSKPPPEVRFSTRCPGHVRRKAGQWRLACTGPF
jgi:F-box and leucine-rich repeat protein GRR1